MFLWKIQEIDKLIGIMAALRALLCADISASSNKLKKLTT